MKKVITVFGTRPEAIKMAPLVAELKKEKSIDCIVCVTGQHREMLDQVLDVFGIYPEYDLSVMKQTQTLFDITTLSIEGLKSVFEAENPDMVLVHGDTTTAFTAALAAYYLHIPVGHVEAGLRTNDIFSPFPEEFNRQAIGLIAQLHFAPTQAAKNNLISEGKDPARIFVTGNTAIDALKTTVREDHNSELLDWAKGSRLIVLTAHRRENLGQPFRNMLNAVKRIVDEVPDIKVIYPVHLNPQIRCVADELLGNEENIRLVSPLDAISFHNLMASAYLILTDSGGIQEEAPSLGKPVLVMREVTERPEGVAAGTLKLIGTNEERIYSEIKQLLSSEEIYNKMSKADNPYGDGNASKRICDAIKGWFV